MRILCVCLGNICRSPTAEAVLRALDQDLVVDSAGTSGWSAGNPPHGLAIQAAAKRGYDLRPLRARKIGQADFSRFDLILAMDSENLADIKRLRPPGAETPVHLLLDYAENYAGKDLPDPYLTGDFEGTLDLIEIAAKGLLKTLNRA